ncbi:hypothetical protein CEO98_26255, partial [Klebsiella pneumoniae]
TIPFTEYSAELLSTYSVKESISCFHP